MKKMSFLLAIVLLLSFCLGGCSQPQPNPKLDDLNLLCETLETGHYDLYANISEEEFQAEREKIARQTLNMTDAEFYWSVRHLALAGRGRAYYRLSQRLLHVGAAMEHQKV